jgi:hypothetical protein
MKSSRVVGFAVAVIMLAASLSLAQTQPSSGNGMDAGQPGDEEYSGSLPPGVASVPRLLSLPAGMLLAVRTTQPLSSDHSRAGDSFTAILEQPVVAQGWVVARRGQIVMGRVAIARKAGRGHNSSELAVELSDLNLVDGQPVPIRTELAEISRGRSSRALNEGAAVGATTGTGAVIGAIAGGGTGAAIGAAIGAAAGVAGILSTRDRATEIEPETILTFRLSNPVTISTEQSRQAFLPVSSGEFNRGPARNPDRYPAARNSGPEVRRYFYPYDSAWYAPPYNSLGIYGYWAPRYYGVFPRVYSAPGYRRRYR